MDALTFSTAESLSFPDPSSIYDMVNAFVFYRGSISPLSDFLIYIKSLVHWHVNVNVRYSRKFAFTGFGWLEYSDQTWALCSQHSWDLEPTAGSRENFLEGIPSSSWNGMTSGFLSCNCVLWQAHGLGALVDLGTTVFTNNLVNNNETCVYASTV